MVHTRKDPGRECTEVPDKTSARERLGMSTISSIGLSPGNAWREMMVYDSS